MTINGTFHHESNENMEAFLTSLGLPEDKIERMCSAKPTITLNMYRGKLDIQCNHDDKVCHNVLILGQPSTYTLASGFQIEVNLGVSENTGKGTLKFGEHTGEYTLEVTDTNMTEELCVGDETCKRTYTRA